ncbi:hypothetical protein [Sinorhizobium sp. CCBAU 05631]|uniref:hypothetical protein n=1 Tax=Sinorhizobium sp. CCBAU 05631 TaxID=794846 RepID=UPI0004AD79FA|nr:hypothetical protein [Sinorhizobium sp. CCBAU 05631]ASY56473.1 hypothetical protein SS05631_c15370 [Sinorhizobium sp. CCBAU 05631]
MSAARFSIIPGWVVADSRLKGRDLQVLCVLGQHTNRKHGWCRRSQVKMAAEMGCARSTVQASLDRLVKIGAVERREVVSDSGRDSAHWYRVIYDRVTPEEAFREWDRDDELSDEDFAVEYDGDTPADQPAPPAGISAPPAGPESAPPAGPGSAPINDSCLTPPVERTERGRGRDDGESDDPAKFVRRVKALELGTVSNPWPGAIGSSTTWAVTQFEKLTAEERRLAEERRDAYLAECKAQKVKPVALGIYLKDRKFLHVSPVAAKVQAARTKIPVAPFGPVWAGMRALALLDGPEPVEVPLDVRDRIKRMFETLRRTSEARALAYLHGKGIALAAGELLFPHDFDRAEQRRRVCESGYPRANDLHKQAKERERGIAEARFEALVDLCEPVPIGSDLFEEWRAHHEAAGWPFVPDPGQMPVVYFPKGGPEGLHRFEMAARAALRQERSNDDAA